ncbi:MAG: BamA/TamA family outer membrane protein [Megasphaera sp.]|jgi:outer membrane protein insertion porin family|nr:BamA/TamA family outer membrane protein [Megasphaera sp.]MCI1248047.1 BamA/TamA family outer membrane protein [Megasphaera sp.]
MKTRNRKFLALMIMSAMMTCPVWANDETGYDPANGETVKATASSAETNEDAQKLKVNTVVTSAPDATTESTMESAKSGLTGYETDAELAAIAAGNKSATEVQQEAAANVDAIAAKQEAQKNESVIQTTAEAAKQNNLPGTSVAYVNGISDVQVDTTVPNYPIATLPTGAEANLPYGNAVTDDEMAPYLNKTTTSVTISPVPDQRIETQILPNLAMRVGDAINADYIRHDLNIIGAAGLFSTVKPAFTNVPEGVKLNYTVQMNPVVNNVDIQGNESIKTEELRKLITVTPGSVINTTLISKDVSNINTVYGNAGYMLSKVSDVSIDDQGILHIGISEAHIEDIRLRGNTKTKNKVILRELRFKKGDVFNKDAASRSIQRVYNTGYFEDVNVRLLPGQVNRQNVIVEIDVVEQKTGSVTIGAGYSDSDGLVGILGLSETNLRGTGDKASISWEFGGNTNSDKNYIFSYTHPWMNDHGDSIGFSLFDRESEYEDYNEDGDSVADYDKRTTGFNVTYGRVRSEYVSDYVTLETKKTKYTDYESGYNYRKWQDNFSLPDNYRHYLDNNFGRTNSMIWSHVFDNRDNVYDPTKGKRLSFTGTWAGHGLGGDFDYFKFVAENRLYYKVGRSHVIAVRLMGGIATGDMPYNDLFTLGGADSLRGYEDDEFRGNKMYAATVEYRYPIAKKVQGVFFVDGGNAWGGTDKVPWYNDSNEFHYSGGLGFRITTPIGPIRLDYGVGDNGGKFHFSFGGKF